MNEKDSLDRQTREPWTPEARTSCRPSPAPSNPEPEVDERGFLTFAGLEASRHQPLGTKWVAPGEGATVRDLMEALPYNKPLIGDSLCLRIEARTHLNAKMGLGLEAKTNLALAGGPLTNYDLRRIAVCE